jgi:hypothetical protein
MNSTVIKKYAIFSGVIAVMFEWIALSLFYFLQPQYFDGLHSISFFATLPQTRLIFAACYTIAAINFWLFFRTHISRRYKTPIGVLAISLISFAAVAILPYNPMNSLSSFIHISLFLTSSVTFMYVMYDISTTEKGLSFRFISKTMFALSVITFLAYIMLSKSYLTMPLEAGWWLVLQIWVIWISYHGRE